jgi:hypothetical protein
MTVLLARYQTPPTGQLAGCGAAKWCRSWH